MSHKRKGKIQCLIQCLATYILYILVPGVILEISKWQVANGVNGDKDKGAIKFQGNLFAEERSRNSPSLIHRTTGVGCPSGGNN